MSCEKCKRFPAPTSAFEEVGISVERHGTLRRCKYCGKYYEIVAGERSYTELNEKEAIKFYNLRVDE